MQELTKGNIKLYAAQNYRNKRVLSVDEFEADFKRFVSVKKLFSRYSRNKDLKEHLLLNHLISIYNVFHIEAATEIILFKLLEEDLPAFKSYLMFLNYISGSDFGGIDHDQHVLTQIESI